MTWKADCQNCHKTNSNNPAKDSCLDALDIPVHGFPRLYLYGTRNARRSSRFSEREARLISKTWDDRKSHNFLHPAFREYLRKKTAHAEVLPQRQRKLQGCQIRPVSWQKYKKSTNK